MSKNILLDNILSTAHKIITATILMLVIVSCSREEVSESKKTKISTKAPIQESVRYKTETFNNYEQKYFSGKDDIKIAMDSLSDEFFGSDGDILFDPHKARTNSEIQLADALYLRLVSIDPKYGVAKPLLAESWSITKLRNGYTYVFNLADATWSDGRPIEADQVKASLLRAMNPRIKNWRASELSLAIRGGYELYSKDKDISKPFLQEIEKRVQINAIDDKTLYITTASLDVDLLKVLANPVAAILPIVTSQAQTDSILSLDPTLWVGAGAYKPEFFGGDQMVLVENPNSIARAFLKKIDIVFTSSIARKLELFESGAVDWMDIPYSIDTEKALGISVVQPSIENSIENIEVAAEVFLDVPEYSILRTSFLRAEDLEAVRANPSLLNYSAMFSAEESKSVFSTLERILRDISSRIFSKIDQDNFSVKKLNSIYLPTVSLPSSDQLTIRKNLDRNEEERKLEAERQSAANPDGLPQEIFEATNDINNNELDIDRIPEGQIASNNREDYYSQQSQINIIRNLLRRQFFDNKEIRVAYSAPFLADYAQEIVAYFESNNIPAVLLPMLDSNDPATETYDIALRNWPLLSTSKIGYLAPIFWVWAGGKESPLRVLGRLHVYVNELVFSKDANSFVDMLNQIEKDVRNTQRVVPLFYLPKKEILRNRNLYPWWTPRVSWHPLSL